MELLVGVRSSNMTVALILTSLVLPKFASQEIFVTCSHLRWRHKLIGHTAPAAVFRLSPRLRQLAQQNKVAPCSNYNIY